MRNSVVVTLVLVALILGGAFVLYERLFATPTTEVAGDGRTPEPKRDAGPTTASGTAPTSETPDAGLANAPVVEQRATVVSTRGRVEVKGGGGEWAPVEAGRVLSAEESLRTGRNGEANLAFGDGIEVRISPRSEFAVRELADDLSRIRLEEGHVAASVDPAKNRALQVEAKGSDALAESRGGAFGVVTDGRGQLTVATETGSVKLSSKGKTVEVGAGTTSTVTAEGDGPTAPRAIPKSLFVKLQGASDKRTNRTVTTVVGETTPGAIVRVDGELAQVDSKGRFRVKVKLKDGANRVSVNVLDAMGREESASTGQIVVDRVKPKIETNMTWGGGG